jgi:uncharacterized RDD family membrane protein YckC
VSKQTTVSSSGFGPGSASTAPIPSRILDQPSIPPSRATAAPDSKAQGTTASAGFVSRFLAMAIDLAVIVGIDLGAGATVQLVHLLLPEWVWLTSAIPAVITGVIEFVPFAYFFATVAVTGQTVGKLLMGLRVVSVDGRRLGIVRTLVRTLAYLVSLIPLFAGFLWVLVDGDRRAWHDHIAGTRVVFDHGKASDQ